MRNSGCVGDIGYIQAPRNLGLATLQKIYYTGDIIDFFSLHLLIDSIRYTVYRLHCVVMEIMANRCKE